MGQQTTAVTNQGAQQLELLRGEMDALARHAHGVLGQVDLQGTRLEDGSVDGDLGTTEDRLEARDELARCEG